LHQSSSDEASSALSESLSLGSTLSPSQSVLS